MKICIIASNYPSTGNPKHVFLEKIVKEFVDLGNECIVIAPQAGKQIRDLKAKYQTDLGNEYIVYSPFYHNFSGKKIGPIKLGVLTQHSFQKAVNKTYIESGFDCDIFYSHFINAGVAANQMSKLYHKPFVVANGESSLNSFIETLSTRDVVETYNRVNAIVSVSTANKQEVLESGFFDKKFAHKIHVLPNGVNSSNFYHMDKKDARLKLNLPLDLFIVIFVGQFSERKGSKRVSKALENCPNVYSIFIGSGSEQPDHKNCLYKGRVDNSELKYYLNAADVFILPTLNEGCCNAIVEALACGLPVISSDLPFNYDILDESCSIMIDPNDIGIIEKSIKRLQSNPDLLNEMSRNSITKSKPFKLNERAISIIEIFNCFVADEEKKREN